MTRTLTIPLGYRLAQPREIALQIPDLPLTEPEWAVFMTVLQAMKPALAEPDVVDASVLDVHDLSPDERIEVARALREYAIGVAPRDDRAHMQELADRLDWFERETDDRHT